MNHTMEAIDQAQKILRRKSIDGYEVYLNQSSQFDVESKDGKTDFLQTSRYTGMAFRVLNRQRMGFSYTTFSEPFSSVITNSPRELERIIEDAIRSAEAVSSDPCSDFAPPLKTPLPSLPIYDGTMEGVSEKTKIEKAKHLEASVRSVDPEKIKKVRKAAYHEASSSITLINSNGLHISHVRTIASVSVTAVAEASGEAETGWDFDVSHFFNDLDVEKAGRSAGKKALDRLGGKRISTGIYSVILNNQVASEFLSLLAHSFLGDQVQKGKSFLKGKRGEIIFSPLLSIVDDGLYPEGIFSAPIDGEGMPSQKSFLVAKGEVIGYLYDRYWSNRENLAPVRIKTGSTGNSRRQGIKSPPGVGVSNFFIEPGELDQSELIKNLHQGVVLEEVMGLHTVDPITGDFSLGGSGVWVAGGEKIHPVKSIAVAGNFFDLFKKVAGVGKDRRFFGGVGAPSLLVESLMISGS